MRLSSNAGRKSWAKSPPARQPRILVMISFGLSERVRQGRANRERPKLITFFPGPPLLHVPRLLPFAPRVVLRGEAKAVGQRRMVIEPERDEGAGVGIGEVGLAENLERLRRGTRSIGHQAV